MSQLDTDSPAIPRYVHITKWIWLVGMAVSLVAVAVTTAMYPFPLLWMMLGITVLQAAVALPAALMLTRRKRWARMTLMVLALLSIGSLYSAVQTQAWPSLVFNLILASTLGFLQDPSVRDFFGLAREPWLRRRLRGASHEQAAGGR